MINAPGSWHDARVAHTLYERLRSRTPDGFYLVADTAFPRTGTMKDRIRTASKSTDKPPANRADALKLNALNRQLLSYRQAAEWGMREIRGSFGRLRIPLPIENTSLRRKLLKLAGKMHQLRVRRVGISHIMNTYMPIWKDGIENIDVWENWEKMLFRDMRRKDRVSRFHNVHE